MTNIFNAQLLSEISVCNQFAKRDYLHVVDIFMFIFRLSHSIFFFSCFSLTSVKFQAIYFRIFNQDVPLSIPYLEFLKLLNCNNKMCQ